MFHSNVEKMEETLVQVRGTLVFRFRPVINSLMAQVLARLSLDCAIPQNGRREATALKYRCRSVPLNRKKGAALGRVRKICALAD